LGASSLLAKTAMSGMAAGIVGGQTLHTWAGLPIKTSGMTKWLTHPSKEMLARRKRNFGPVLWLIVDEKSMLTAPLLARLSQLVSIVRTGIFSVAPSIPFGGVSVILMGDLHQIPTCCKHEQGTLQCSPLRRSLQLRTHFI
jgi:hypothetical protein